MRIAFVIATVFMVSFAQAESAPVAVEKVRAFRDGDTFAAEMQTTTAWNGTDVSVQYFKDSIQIDVAGAFLNKGKQLIKVDDRVFKSVYSTQFDATTVRTRFTMKQGLTAKSLAGRLHAKHGATTLTFEVAGDAAAKADGKVSDEAQKVAVNDQDATPSDSLPAKLVAGATAAADAAASATTTVAAAALKADAAKTDQTKSDLAKIGDGEAGDAKAADAKSLGATTADAKTAAPKVDTNKLPENEIPVLSAAKNEKKQDSNPYFRLITTLGILAITLGAGAYGVKKMSQRQIGKAASKTKINVLTTHHLGPKKNLMIVQVAGETLLIGVTDHNISMLKTLALIDDEVPAEMPQQFNHSMEDFIEEEDTIAMQGLDQIRDTARFKSRNF